MRSLPNDAKLVLALFAMTAISLWAFLCGVRF